MITQKDIVNLFNRGTHKLDSKNIPLPKSLEIHPVIKDGRCILYFQVSIELKGCLTTQFISSFVEMEDYIHLYVEYLRGLE